MHNLFILTCIHKQPQVGTHIIIWPFNRGWLNALVLPLVEEFGFRLTCDSALACGTKDQLMKKTLKKKKYWLMQMFLQKGTSGFKMLLALPFFIYYLG